jgi:hypothetical protein
MLGRDGTGLSPFAQSLGANAQRTRAGIRAAKPINDVFDCMCHKIILREYISQNNN